MGQTTLEFPCYAARKPIYPTARATKKIPAGFSFATQFLLPKESWEASRSCLGTVAYLAKKRLPSAVI